MTAAKTMTDADTAEWERDLTAIADEQHFDLEKAQMLGVIISRETLMRLMQESWLRGRAHKKRR